MDTVEKKFFETYRPDELHDIFPFLSAEEMVILFAYLELREWQPDEIVIKNGDPGDFAGFLVEGKLAVKMEAIFPGKFIMVAILERGSLVGEVSFVEEGQRHATVVAMEKSKLLVLPRENMALILQQAPALGMKLLQRTIRVLGQRLGQASDRLARLL